MKYLGTIGLWLRAFPPIWQGDRSLGRKTWWTFVLLFNVGTNVFTGGDVKTWSATIYEDMDTLIFGFLARIVEKFDPGHGDRALAGNILEDSPNSREYRFWARILITLAWAGAITAAIMYWRQ